MHQPDTGTIEFDPTERENQVIGTGQRIDPLANEDVDEEAWDILNAVLNSIGGTRRQIMPAYLRTMLRHRELFRCQMDLGKVLFEGQISPRDRELAVLRVAWLSRAPYEWGEHVNIGRRYGLSTEEIARVKRGSSAPEWTEHEAAILRGVEELIADQAISDVTWETLAKRWTEEQLIEFPMMVGQYVAAAFIQNSLRISLIEGNPGLRNG